MTTPTPVRTWRKDPDAVLDYGFDWSLWLGSGEVITASSWTSDGSGLVHGVAEFSDETTTIWLSGGTDGATYLLTNSITTSDGRTDDRTAAIVVNQR
jgi:hypothetical protein